MSEKTQSYAIERSTRSTGMGAYDDGHLYSLRQEKELKPHRERYSRTGNHGKKTWFLWPCTYYECWCSFSNSGKGGWHLDMLTVSESGEESRKPVKNPPDWLMELLPTRATKALFPVAYS